MDSKSKTVARNVIARLMVKAGQPVLNQESSFERWFNMLDAAWDQYAAKVAGKPFLSVWTRHGWTREKLINDCRLSSWDEAVRKDDHLATVWAALEAVRPLWRYRWHEPLFITAMDNLVATFFECGDSHYWQLELGAIHSLDISEFEGATDETLWFELWPSYSLNAARCSFERNYAARELSYSEWQYRLRDRKYVAVYRAYATIRTAALAGAQKCPEGNAQLTAALALPGGMFDDNGAMIWFQDLTDAQRTEWDNLQKTLPSTIVKPS